MKNTTTRRGFIKQVAATGVGLTIGGMSFKATSAKSYANIMGSNERVNMAVMGTNGRGAGMARNFQSRKDVEMRYVCDVEEKALAKGVAAVKKVGGNPKTEKDIRKILEDKNIDAILVTAPDHWHAPATIMACQAGKHVYCEKPCRAGRCAASFLAGTDGRDRGTAQWCHRQGSFCKSLVHE